jgi:hypothetical protein
MTTTALIREFLLAALGVDLIGPCFKDLTRSHERLPQPPSVWYSTGFLVSHVFQQEAGRVSDQEKYSFADLAGEEPSNDRDGVQARLLALNAERYEEEVAHGLHSKSSKKASGPAAPGAKRRGRPPKSAQAGENGSVQAEQIGLAL